ncbi:MAG: hypothetical protein ACOZFS_14570 [Thermodesulfobacteriota bacterium]
MEEKKSFWTTLPGILTGIASILAALGGLIGAWYQFVRPVPPVPKEPTSVTQFVGAQKQPTPSPGQGQKPELQTALKPTPKSAPQAPAPLSSTPKAEALKVMFDFGHRSEIRAGEGGFIRVLVLSPDGKAVIKGAKVKLTASEGFFEKSGSAEIKGTTDGEGSFGEHWYTHAILFSKGETSISFDALVSRDGEEGHGKGGLVVTKQ